MIKVKFVKSKKGNTAVATGFLAEKTTAKNLLKQRESMRNALMHTMPIMGSMCNLM